MKSLFPLRHLLQAIVFISLFPIFLKIHTFHYFFLFDLFQVRAGSLQDLVFKGGQAGITKASVTLTFDNRDTSHSPIGYEQHEEITVTRQVGCVLITFRKFVFLIIY